MFSIMFNIYLLKQGRKLYNTLVKNNLVNISINKNSFPACMTKVVVDIEILGWKLPKNSKFWKMVRVVNS